MEKQKYWYPIRVTYSRELKVKEILDMMGIDNFIPMHYVQVIIKERLVRKLVPAIHNLLFVHVSKEDMKNLKKDSLVASQIRYIMDRETHLPLIIPEKQMQNFIAVAGNYDEQILYLNPEEVALKKGDIVRVTDGIWKGIEGKFIRVKKGLRVVITITGLTAVATTSLPLSLVEKVNKK